MRSLIGRYHFGREIEDETKVKIRNSSQNRKGLPADAESSRVHPVLAISLVKAAPDINLSQEALSKGYLKGSMTHLQAFQIQEILNITT